jgi:hypothetical protein
MRRSNAARLSPRASVGSRIGNRSRKKIVASYADQQLELFPVGTPDVSFDDHFAFQNLICRDQQTRVFSVEIRQRLFLEEKLRVTTKRIPGKRGNLTAENCARLSAIVREQFAKEGC